MKPDWKYMLACVAALFIAISSVYACFVADPTSSTSNPSASIVGGNGSSSDVTIPGENHPGTVVENPGWQVDPDDPRDDYSYALTVDAAFPLTLNVSFSGFLDEAGEQVDEPITRMCLLYFSTAGRWTSDIRPARECQYFSISGLRIMKISIWKRCLLPITRNRWTTR